MAFGNATEALPIYIDLATRTPEDVEVLLALGHVSLAMDESENAVSFYRKVLALAPDNDHAAQGLAALEGTAAVQTKGTVHHLRYVYQTPAEALAARDYPITEADCRWDVDPLTGTTHLSA